LIGGRQATLGLADDIELPESSIDGAIVVRTRPEPLEPRVSEAEREAHRAFIATLGENAIWLSYRE